MNTNIYLKKKKKQLQEKVWGHFRITMIFGLIGFKMKINLYAFQKSKTTWVITEYRQGKLLPKLIGIRRSN